MSDSQILYAHMFRIELHVKNKQLIMIRKIPQRNPTIQRKNHNILKSLIKMLFEFCVNKHSVQN